MAIKLEKVVEKFYQNLEEGKITGRKCTKCGAVEFPPVYACNTCGCWDMEWVEISAKLEKGCLTVSATKNVDNDQKDEDGKYIRRERYYGSMSRSFYVGDSITQEDIHAKYEDGILHLTVPKEAPKKVEESRFIAIEG